MCAFPSLIFVFLMHCSHCRESILNWPKPLLSTSLGIQNDSLFLALDYTTEAFHKTLLRNLRLLLLLLLMQVINITCVSMNILTRHAASTPSTRLCAVFCYRMITGPGLRPVASMHEILSEILLACFGFS
jgi:uncharacterized integral membrane protein